MPEPRVQVQQAREPEQAPEPSQKEQAREPELEQVPEPSQKEQEQEQVQQAREPELEQVRQARVRVQVLERESPRTDSTYPMLWVILSNRADEPEASVHRKAKLHAHR